MKTFWKQGCLGVVLLSLCLLGEAEAQSESAHPPYQANGVKIGEGSSSSVIIWTRLTIKEAGNEGRGAPKLGRFGV